MSNLAYATLNEKENYSIKKMVINGTMAACVATSGVAIVGQFFTKPTKPRPMPLISSANVKQTANIIKSVPLSYTRPKPYARSKTFVLRTVASKGAKSGMMEHEKDQVKMISSSSSFTGPIIGRERKPFEELGTERIIKNQIQSKGIIESTFSFTGPIKRPLS
ncbi:hypothetical protein [Neobacillus sp. DY30]|uniref:hypothetical protein n=1 Tax=Neobacillus sp. DY30 TaxID=3047871 RepID=UPI0024C038A1|nr:hypothetical protein [Neobacillus sp. DY30]WHY01353.1 hypothetical protein QNH29_03620 [Neobacillus sp. DY30]